MFDGGNHATSHPHLGALLCRYGLGRLSPLLSGVLAVDNGKVKLTVTPQSMTAPSNSYRVRLEPLRYFTPLPSTPAT